MQRWLVEEGIAADRIHTESTANSTVQNAQRATALAAEIGVDDLVLATTPVIFDERSPTSRSRAAL